MSGYLVEIEYHDYDDDSYTDLIGPFRARDAAQRFADRLEATLPERPDGADGSVHVSVRSLQEPRIRPFVREARRFWAALAEEGPVDHFDSGANSADHWSG